MGTSTVSGPFRSANGFQELVNGQWVPVAGGGGGGDSGADVTVRGTIYPDQPDNIYCSSIGCYGGYSYFSIPTGYTFQQIQDDLTNGGKWSCFSGYELSYTVFANPVDSSMTANLNIASVSRLPVVYNGNCVAIYDTYYTFTPRLSDGSCIFPIYQSRCIDDYTTARMCGGYGSNTSWTVSFPSCGWLAASVLTDQSCVVPSAGGSLSCIARFFYKFNQVTVCGYCPPGISYCMTLKFNSVTNGF